MLDLKHSTYTTKAKGSSDLKDRLKTGDIKAIADHFALTYVSAYNIITGKHNGDVQVVQCAERIAAFYNEVNLDHTVTSIIKSYETIK